MSNIKISVIGAGAVGATLAMRITENNLADVVLVDIDAEIAKGKAFDIEDSLAILGIDRNIKGTADYKDIEGSKIIVVTAGFPRKPGMTRDDLLLKNAQIIKNVALEIKRFAKGSIVIVVTNPLDVMSYLTYRAGSFDPKRVIGMAGILDSARLAAVLKNKMDISLKDISSEVLGSHGDSMVIASKFVNIAKSNIKKMLNEKEFSEIKTLTKNRGAEIVGLLKSGSAYFAPSQAVRIMIENILLDKKDLISASCYLDGEYGMKGLYIGVPARIGKNGVEEIVEVELSPAEKKEFTDSCEVVKDSISKLNLG